MANGIATGSAFAGVVRVFQAGERLLVDQAELVRLESHEKIASVMLRFGLAAAAVWFLLTAWLGLLATAIVAFDAQPLALRIGLAALAQLGVGLALLTAARFARRDSKEEDGDAT